MPRRALLLSSVPALFALAACGGTAEQPSGDSAAAPTSAPSSATAATPTPATSATDATPSASASASAPAAPTPAPVASVAQPAKFTTCAVCHSIERGQNGIGPSLAGVVGRRAGTAPGANYSPAMQGANVTWTEANLRRYLVDPASVVPGGLMPAPGLSAAEAQTMVNYLKTL